jgi:hypothetical protein
LPCILLKYLARPAPDRRVGGFSIDQFQTAF